MMKKIISAVLVSALFFGIAADISAVSEDEKIMMQFYVSTNGDDSGDGSRENPFGTIERAKNEVRKYNADMTGDIVVNISEGTYFPGNTLKFTQEDSATGGFSVIYKGESAENTILSGGKKLSDWQLHDKNKNIWAADAKGVKSRNLFVNGERRMRAATYDFPEMKAAKEEDKIIITGNNIFSDIENINDVEIIWKKSFSDYRMPIKAIEDNVITLPVVNQTYGTPTIYPVMRIENAYKWLDEQGEWYLDKKADKVYYIPENGEDPTKEDIVISDLEKIIDIEGTKEADVKGITFENVTMKDTTWMGPSDTDYGYANFQAGFCREFDPYYGDNDYYNVKSAVCVLFAENINIKRCIIKNCGGAGVWMRKGVKNSSVCGNLIYDISQNGVMLGNTFPWQAQNEIELCDNVKIENNVIHDAGIEFLGAVGIFAGYPRNSSVSYNEVYNIPYTCISFGWGWLNDWPKEPENNDREAELNCDNKIMCNYVHDSMTKLNDGGGIYTLGFNPRLEIAGNVVADMGNNECFAYYMDNGTRWIKMHDNVSFGVDIALYSKGADNEFYNNYFDAGFDNKSVIGDQRIGHSEYKQLPVPDGHENRIYDNTVIKDANFPEHIMYNAGISYEFQDILGLSGKKDENIAAKKTASAKVIKPDGKIGRFAMGKDFAAAVDENTETFAKATGKGGWTFSVDLGEKRKLNKIKISFGEIPQKVTLAVTENGKDFSDIPFESIKKDNEIVIEDKIVRNIRLTAVEGEMTISGFGAFADDFIKKESSNKLSGLTLVTFDDIKGHWAKESIEYFASKKIVDGYTKTEFMPDKSITRAEWIVMLTRTTGLQKKPYTKGYNDVFKEDWFSDYVQAARDKGLLFNCFGEKTLNPEKEITRGEACATLLSLEFRTEDKKNIDKNSFTDIENDVYKEAIYYALDNGIMNGRENGIFAPTENLTRAEAVTILERVFEKIIRE